MRLPPHSSEAEQSVIGAVMVDAKTWDHVADVVGEDDFYLAVHRAIWREMTRVFERGDRPDVVTLAQRVDPEMDGPALAYLGDLMHNTPSVANVVSYANIVVERRRERQLLAAASTIPEIVADRAAPFAERLDRAQSAFLEVDTPGAGGPRPISDVLRTAMEALEGRYERGGAISGTSTGFVDLDAKIDGLHEGEFVVLAARPSMGKSALAMDIALNVARAGGGVLFASLEMPSEQLVDRAISSLGRIPHEQVRSGRLPDEAWPRITSSIAAINELQIRIDDDPGLTLSALRARGRRVRREIGNLALVVVDYLQLMTAPKADSRREQVDALSRGLKLMAKDLKVPMLVLAQLNRAVEQRSNKRPILSDLRESGSIEQDADTVLLLYRPSVYGKSQPGRPDFTEVIVGKQRNGPIGSVWLQFQGAYSSFVSSERPAKDDLEPSPEDLEVGFDG